MRVFGARARRAALLVAALWLMATPVSLASGRDPHQPPTATASSTGSTAYIYTDDSFATMPTQTTGTVHLSAKDCCSAGVSDCSDQAKIEATFSYPTSDTIYTVRLTGVEPRATTCTHFGGVGLLKPIFGPTGIGGAQIPMTLAYVAIFGRATVQKNGQVIAENQPVMAFVTQGLHDAAQRWLGAYDPTAQEIGLVVPGLMESDAPIPGFPNGGFYIYWPDAAFELRNVGGKVAAPSAEVQASQGRGPAPQAAMTPLNIVLTGSGMRAGFSRARRGLYQITVTNSSSRPTGIVMSGTDICCTEYNRFSTLIKPGQSHRFRFYFAPGRVTFKDFLSATRTKSGFTNVRYAGHSASIVFE